MCAAACAAGAAAAAVRARCAAVANKHTHTHTHITNALETKTPHTHKKTTPHTNKRLEKGTTYNSYLIFGADATCLVDASHEKFGELWVRTLKEQLAAAGGKKVEI